jgi:predicted transcriptional regulator YdeE
MKTKSMLRLMMTTISLIWLSSTAYGNDDHYHFNGRVAILVSNRSNIDENFCMGLLVAQDYVMAHVHCIQSNPNLTWAYFGDSALDGNGNSHDGDNYDYYDYDYDYDYEEEEEEQEYDEFSSDNSNLERGNGHKKEMDCIVTPEFCSDTE